MQKHSDTNALASIILAAVLFLAGIAYLHYLDAGCPTQGAMTLHGKICVTQ